MPLDKARIQGFGSDGAAEPKVPSCPAGHELQLWAARSGKCDGCGRKVQAGELVMDCRRCNWYLCNVCCPQDKTQESSLWGAISSLPFYVMDDMSEMATDLETVVWTNLFDEKETLDGQGKSSAQSTETPVSPRQKAEATQVVTEFCETYPALRVVPNEMDLDVFWAKCSVLQPKPIADAIYDQLSFSGGDNDWQPRLRALYAIEHLHGKGGVGKEITRVVMHSAKGLLQHLSEIPQCTIKANQVINVLKGVKPPEAAAPKKEEVEVVSYPRAEVPVPEPKDLLDTSAAPEVVPKVAPKASQDLLDFVPDAPRQAPPTSRQAANDLLDFTVAPAVAAAPPVGDLLASTLNAAASQAKADAMAPPKAAGAASLADLYALYPQSKPSGVAPLASGSAMPSMQMPQPMVPQPMVLQPMVPQPMAHLGSKDAAFSSLAGPMAGPMAGFGGMAASPAPSTTAGRVNGMHSGIRAERPAESTPNEVTSSGKDKGLDSLMSDALAGLGNLGPLAAH